MNARLDRLLHIARTSRILVKASRYGNLLPPEGRPAPCAAPGGTRDERPKGNPVRRFFDEVDWLAETHHTLPVPGLARPVDILHLTDLHLRGLEPSLDRLTWRLAALRPDLVAITGDVVTRGWTLGAVERLLGALPPAPLGRWAVLGNWEHWAHADIATWAPLLARHGVGMVHNGWRALGPLVLAGTDDLLAGVPDLKGALGGRPPGVPTVVLSHSPAIFPQLVQDDVRLVLSGHTHGGQLRLPGLGALWVPRGSVPYVAGWYRLGESWLFVSRGVGWSVAPVRMWCTPELATIRLEPA